MNDINVKFSNNLINLIRKHEIKINDFSINIGISKDEIYNYVIEGTIPSIETLIKLSDMFHISIDELIGRSHCCEKMKFSYNLKKSMENCDINQTQLAAISGVGKSTISTYMNGTLPTLENIIKISKALNVTIDELLG